MEEEAKQVFDAFAVGGTVGTLIGWLPPIASMLTIVWLGLRIWESTTVQDLVKKNNDR